MNSNRKFLTALTLIVVMISIGIAPAMARVYNDGQTSRPILMPGRLEVQFESDVNAEKLSLSLDRVSFGISTLDKSLEKIGAIEAVPMFPWREGLDAMVGTDDMSKYYEVIFSEEININAAIDELTQNPYVRSVFPVFALPIDVNPNDPSFLYQWGLKKINDTAAYNIEKGSDTAKIAIIDSGVLYSHPDLRDNIWVNPGEDLDNDLVVMDPDDANYIDNDGNYYDDLIGYDFFTGFSGITCWPGEDCSVPDNDPIDWNGHGTHCAGIAAAVSNNSIGGAGTAGGWGGGLGAFTGPRIMCIRAGASAVHPDYGYETGYLNSANCATAVAYAVKMGADAINCSWGMSQSTAMSNALQEARDSGIVVVHSAGNEGVTTADYYDTWMPDGEKVVISVAWTNGDDRKNTSSNYGYWIDICAPGTSIYSTVSVHHTASYASYDGTSMSTPFVVGAVALLRSHDPEITRTEIIDLIFDNADEMPTEPLWNQGFLGWGRLNTYKTLDSLSTAAFSAGPVLIGEAPLTVDFTDESPFSPTSWTWDFGDGGDAYIQNPQHTYTDYGFYTTKLTVDDDFGTNTEVLKNLVMVTADTIRIGSTSCKPDTQIVIPVYLDNKYQVSDIIFPIMFREQDGSVPTYLRCDSIVPDSGSRIAYFERVKKQTSDNVNKRYTYLFNSDYYGDGSNYLQPDTGHVFNLYISLTGSLPSNKIITITDTTISSWNLELQSIINDYTPVLLDGQITILVCQRGDANLDEAINVLDITNLIDWLYKDGWWPPDPVCGDVNADGTINIMDIVYLIDYLYKGGPPPPA